jgi:hypothetical protein
VRNAAPLEHDDLVWYAAADLSGLALADASYPALIARVLDTVHRTA